MQCGAALPSAAEAVEILAAVNGTASHTLTPTPATVTYHPSCRQA